MDDSFLYKTFININEKQILTVCFLTFEFGMYLAFGAWNLVFCRGKCEGGGVCPPPVLYLNNEEAISGRSGSATVG
jgi:hypothetical protein